MAAFCPAESTWLEAASFEQLSACGMPTDFVANCTHVSVELIVFISVALTLTLLREHFPNQRVFLICPTSFSSLASRLSPNPNYLSWRSVNGGGPVIHHIRFPFLSLPTSCSSFLPPLLPAVALPSCCRCCCSFILVSTLHRRPVLFVLKNQVRKKKGYRGRFQRIPVIAFHPKRARPFSERKTRVVPPHLPLLLALLLVPSRPLASAILSLDR